MNDIINLEKEKKKTNNKFEIFTVGTIMIKS